MRESRNKTLNRARSGEEGKVRDDAKEEAHGSRDTRSFVYRKQGENSDHRDEGPMNKNKPREKSLARTGTERYKMKEGRSKLKEVGLRGW